MNENECREKIQISEGKIKLLDSYFVNRHNASGKDSNGKDYILEKKTTLEIIDELSDMLDVSREELFFYMEKRNYHIRQSLYGSLYWEIYREIPDAVE